MKVTDNISYNAQWDDQLDRAIHYINQTLNDASSMSISIKWNFDEQQADGFHHSWTGEQFIDAIRVACIKSSKWDKFIDFTLTDTTISDKIKAREQWSCDGVPKASIRDSIRKTY